MTEMTGPMENWNGLENVEQRTNLEVTTSLLDVVYILTQRPLPGSYMLLLLLSRFSRVRLCVTP